MPNPLRRSSTGFLRKGSLGPPPLSTIPTVYFDEGFHLENPRTFDVVSEWSEVVRPPNAGQPKNGDASGTDLVPRKALATNAILQEKLSWYMDTIEVHLINSISTASTTFFSALGSLKELHSETSESVQRIQVLRKELEALDEEIVSSGLQIVQKRRRRENLRQLNDAVLQLRQIVDGFATCESLVDAGEVDEALVKIDSLEKLIAGERDQSEEDSGRQLRDMRSASALQGVNNDLSTLRFRIGKAYESQFANFLMADLRRHVESVTPADVLLRWSNATSRSRELKTQLLQSMIGLHRAKHVATAAMTYREIVLLDVANDKIVKVLRVRGEQATHLPLDFFLRYFTLNLYFANECEAISGRSGTSLKTVVNGHIKDFVQRNRDMEMQKLAVGMESDQWVAKDFTEKNGKLLDLVLKSSTEDGSDWMDSSKIWVPYREFERDLAEPTMDDTNGASKDKVRSAVIEFESFMLPNSAILCLEGMNNFMHLIAGIPSMTTDVAASLIAYLQLFNSRCTQLILGAGATRSAGLKNINAKHLALASQALAFIAAIIPHTREFVRRHAPTGAAASSLMGEFDKVRRLLQEHQDSIHQKLVDIMGGRAAIHAKSIKATDWDAKEVNGPLKFMEVLAKETTTLHRALTKHLPEALIPMIMEPVFSSYKEQIGAAFSEGNPRTEAGHKSMLRNVEFFSSKLGNLHGFGDAGEYLMSIVKAKEIKLEAPAEAVEESSQVSAEVKQVPTEDAKEVAEEKAQDSQDSTAAVEVAPDAKVEPSDS
ncbi:hypothetical protein RJ55_05403 [Drechmeria coniospora]|nr:hypothetical protein RJ55_05403 [Drechmeria coniospora]